MLSHVILALFVVTSGQPIAKSNFQVAYHLGGPLFLVGASLGSTMNTVIRLLPLALVFAFFFAALGFNAPAWINLGMIFVYASFAANAALGYWASRSVSRKRAVIITCFVFSYIAGFFSLGVGFIAGSIFTAYVSQQPHYHEPPDANGVVPAVP